MRFELWELAPASGRRSSFIKEFASLEDAEEYVADRRDMLPYATGAYEIVPVASDEELKREAYNIVTCRPNALSAREFARIVHEYLSRDYSRDEEEE